MLSGFQVIDKIRDYLLRKINLEQFREWAVCCHIQIVNGNEQADPQAAQLLSDIEGRYAELSDDGQEIPEAILRKRLVALIVPLPGSAESYLLEFFYSQPSAVPSQNAPLPSGNFNGAPNYSPQPELECAAA